MQKIVAALALTGAAAFVAPVAPAAGTALNGKEEMVALAESNPDLLGRTIGALPSPTDHMASTPAKQSLTLIPRAGFWDPFNLIAEGDFWGLGNEATIGYLRHAEIKHGRVAMAAFLGFIVQSLPVVSGEHWFAPYRGYVAGVSPQEQWDNMPAIGKLQILVAIGMLESYGEGAGNPEGYVHYCNGPQSASTALRTSTRRRRAPTDATSPHRSAPHLVPSQAASPATSRRSPAAPASARLASTSTTRSTGSTPPTRARTRYRASVQIRHRRDIVSVAASARWRDIAAVTALARWRGDRRRSLASDLLTDRFPRRPAGARSRSTTAARPCSASS